MAHNGVRVSMVRVRTRIKVRVSVVRIRDKFLG